MSSNLPADPIDVISGIGNSYQIKLEKLGIKTIADLLRHYPHRYLDYTKIRKVRTLADKENVCLYLTLQEPKSFRTRAGKLMTSVKASDDTGTLNLYWFNSPYVSRLIEVGGTYYVTGRTSIFAGKTTLVAPNLEKDESGKPKEKGLVPVYPQTDGISSKWLRGKIKLALTTTKITEPFSVTNLPTISEALSNIHFPKNKDLLAAADKRLAFNEHLKICFNNQEQLSATAPSLLLRISQSAHNQLMAQLPFELTSDQEKAITNSYKDLSSPEFTHRLVQGETGSGKTVIMLFLAKQALVNQTSFCLLAPTVILANQHYQTFLKYGFDLSQVQLVDAQNKIGKTDKPQIYIGTHALVRNLPKAIVYPVSVICVDEQHRFGVKDRETLNQRVPSPHLFNFSATPIPRTIALGFFGEIKISTMKEKPKNKKPTKTWIMDVSRYEKSITWLKKIIKGGGKILVVCPYIEENEMEEVASVKKIVQQYQKKYSDQTQVSAIHGAMKTHDIAKALTNFRNNQAGILVSTSIIEVGIDIPEAEVIIIHSAERFGLAQLHQLRGRVGRGDRQGFCLLVTTTSDSLETERLTLLSRFSSGLTLAKKDLALRGAGDLSGVRQHGKSYLRLKNFWRKDLYQKAKLLVKTLGQNQTKNPQIASFRESW